MKLLFEFLKDIELVKRKRINVSLIDSLNTKIALDVVEKAIPIGEATSAAKNDDLYFLWRARKLAK